MTSRFSRRVGVLLVVVVTLLVGSSLFAQGGPGSVNNAWVEVNAKLDRILDALSPDEPEPPSPGPVILTTGLLKTNGVFICTAVNVGTGPVTVTASVRNDDGALVGANGFGTLTPGQGLSALSILFDGSYRCQFSFEGFANDVRGNAQVTPDVTGGSASAVLEAR